MQVDPEYEANEDRYKEIKAEILGDTSSDEEGDDEAVRLCDNASVCRGAATVAHAGLGC